ncbi:MAG: hypothetical protein WBB76_06570 [Gaiellaceae bacterium]
MGSGIRLPPALLLPAGLTVVILAAQFATLADATAELAAPLVVVLAAAGIGLARPWRRRPDPWLVGLGIAVLFVYAAPVLLSGASTFAGYIKLDDTATYFAMTDRVMEHGRNLAGLAPSSYLRTLQTTIAFGYPTGSLMPLGVGHQLLSYDIAWLFQPYLAFLGAMVGLSIYELLRPLVSSRPLRITAAFLAAQPAILYGYSLWGGIKEVGAAALVALVAALIPWTVSAPRARSALPAATACAALVCVLSLPGSVWLGVPLALGAVAVWRTRMFAKTAVFAAATAILAVPAHVAAVDWLPRIHAFRSASELGNLARPLDRWQLFGIWPVGDFREHASQSVATGVLIAIVIAAALAGLWWAWQRRGWGLLVYMATAGIGCAVVVAGSSPWLDGKALATASPAFLAAALAATGFGWARLALIPIAVGVLWSNALAYHDVWLAPREKLHELETIGHRFAGQGPALMTEYEPYGVRHFLRKLDAEGASELRFRHVYMTDGSELSKTESADIDRFRLADVLVYRTLVLRRGPAASRPPSVYRLLWSGRYYEVWQRPVTPARTIVEHLPLGNVDQAAAVPRCADVLRLARLGGSLATATRPEAIPLVSPPPSGNVAVRVDVPAAGRYTAWLGGDWFGLASVSADGRRVGSRRGDLNWPGNYTDLGTVPLSAGPHVITLTYVTGGWHPGSGETRVEGLYGPYRLGPLVLAPADNRRDSVETIPASRARSLCGRRLDWVEAVR